MIKDLNGFLRNKVYVFLYFLLLNLPLIIGTFDTTNWSDDYQNTNLIPTKAKFSSILQVMFNPIGGNDSGGHFAPIHVLFNYLVTFFTFDPRFFHLVVLLIYVATAYILYLIVLEHQNNKYLAILSGTLFSLNYYIGFKAMAWNCFHSHLTNTFTGACSLLFLLKYIKYKNLKFIVICSVLLILTVLNVESGFVFVPMLFVVLIYSYFHRRISLRHGLVLAALLFAVSLAYPLGAYISTKKLNPLSQRIQMSKTPQMIMFETNDLIIKSTGLTIFYNKLVFNELKNVRTLKESMIKLLRQNDRSVIQEIPIKYLVLFLLLGIATLTLGIFLLVQIWRGIQSETFLFLWMYAVLFIVYLVIFYRTDIINALSLCSSVIAADLIIYFLKDKKKYVWVGRASLGLLVIATVWTLCDRFEDCYQKSFFGISKVAIKGPDRIYNDMNQEIGHFVEHGMIFFTHDYSAYHNTIGFERIGDMIGVEDFVCFNATKFYPDLLKTNLDERFKDKTFNEFADYFIKNPFYQKIVVNSREEAMAYLKNHNIDLNLIDVIYLSKDYEVEKIENLL